MRGQIRLNFERTDAGGRVPAQVHVTSPDARDNAAMSTTSPLAGFHPAVSAWFQGAFPAPTEAQAQAWPTKSVRIVLPGRSVRLSVPHVGIGRAVE